MQEASRVMARHMAVVVLVVATIVAGPLVAREPLSSSTRHDAMPTPAAALDPQTEWDDELDSSAGKALSGIASPAKVEQAGVLFQRPDGKYGRSTTIASTQHDHFKLSAQVPQGHKIAGIFHTHLGSDRNAQFFSPDDIEMANQLKVPSYIRFADGSVRKYVPGKTVIGTNWYTNPPRGDAVTAKTGPTEVKVKGSSMAAPSLTDNATLGSTGVVRDPTSMTVAPARPITSPSPGTPSPGGTSGSGTTAPQPPKVPSIQDLQQTTPAAQTVGASTAGAAPTATASDAGLISQATAQQAAAARAASQNATSQNATSQNATAADISSGAMRPNDSTNSASQLDMILGSNSPYIQLAEQQGLISAAGRGLENSSIAAGAAQAAATQAAAPLAEQNAGAATQAELQNKQLGTQVSEQNAQLGTQVAEQNAALGTQVSEQNAAEETNARLQNAQLGTQASEFNTGENVQQALQNAAERTQTSQLNAQLAGQTAQFNAGQTQAAATTNAQAQNAMKAETMQLNNSINQQYLSNVGAQDLASIQGQFNQLIASNQAASNLYESYFAGISSTMANQNIAPSRVADTISADQSMLASGLQIIDELNGMNIDLAGVTGAGAPGFSIPPTSTPIGGPRP